MPFKDPEAQRRYYREYDLKRRAEKQIYNKSYYAATAEVQRAKRKERYRLDPTADREACRRWRTKNRKWKRDYQNRTRAENLQVRLADGLRSRLSTAVRKASRSGGKAGSAVRDLGCSLVELIAWLEARFHPHPDTGELMTWERYGRRGWHIDHVVALKKFDLTDRDQFVRAVHYTNLQPLWERENLSKGAS